MFKSSARMVLSYLPYILLRLTENIKVEILCQVRIYKDSTIGIFWINFRK